MSEAMSIEEIIDELKGFEEYLDAAYGVGVPPSFSAAIEKLKTHPDNQPNEPLTLEELREMDGQPVWIVGVSSFNNFMGQWDICALEHGGAKVFFPDCGENPDVDLYGLTWKAYRRPPKEETT